MMVMAVGRRLAGYLGRLAFSLKKRLQRFAPIVRPLWRPLRLVLRFLLAPILSFWRLQGPTVLIVNAPPDKILFMLARNIKPNMRRLHLDTLYTQGRRYHIQHDKDGFSMMTTSKVIWHYRRRTSSTAVMRVTMTPLDDTSTRLILRPHIRIGYLLSSFLLPIFMISMLVYLPWSPWVVLLLSVALVVLSLLTHRFNAALEANEMAYFIERILEEFLTQEMKPLAGKTPDIVYDDSDFAAAWERFYAEQRRRTS
ncbi:MAG: hypothetical protein D6712_14830 [Chloroflexi bacterium]|nr:MAG: hypothetical protein D6712_14830 [Chloroflexota bacterium]